MSICCQNTITDKAFENLNGIKYIDVGMCTQKTISDKIYNKYNNISSYYDGTVYLNYIYKIIVDLL